jgi:hypothetical protein
MPTPKHMRQLTTWQDFMSSREEISQSGIEPSTQGGITCKNLENHVRENIGWILFETHNFYIFFRYTIASSKYKFGNIYNVWCGLSRDIYYYLDIK